MLWIFISGRMTGSGCNKNILSKQANLDVIISECRVCRAMGMTKISECMVPRGMGVTIYLNVKYLGLWT